MLTRTPAMLRGLALLLAFGLPALPTTLRAQTRPQSTIARDTALLVAERARRTPTGSVNCGLVGSIAAWRSGAVFVDTVGFSSNSQRSVAVGWCSYLATRGFDERIASFVRWSDRHLADDLSLDLGIEWARKLYGGSRIRFQIVQIDTTATERFVVRTFIESLDSTAWKVQAVHTINASVYKDTARFESRLVPDLPSNMRWISAPLEFVRLDSGAIDTTRAKASSGFLLKTRQRAGIESKVGDRILYLYTKAGNGRELLGFSQSSGVVDGFSSPSPTLFIFGNVAAAGESYWHELVHAALMARTPRLDPLLDESLSNALGGTLHRTWTQFLCEDRSRILNPVGAANLAAFFATPEAQLDAHSLRSWENAFYIDYMIAKSGDAALRQLVNGADGLGTRGEAQRSIAAIMAIPVADFMKGVTEYYTDQAINQRCSKQ